MQNDNDILKLCKLYVRYVVKYDIMFYLVLCTVPDVGCFRLQSDIFTVITRL